MWKKNPVKRMLWVLFAAAAAAPAPLVASLPTPPAGMTEVLPAPARGYAPLNQFVRPLAWYRYDPSPLPGDAVAGAADSPFLLELFPDGPPEWLPPEVWVIGRSDWAKSLLDVYWSMRIEGTRYTALQLADLAFPSTPASSEPLPLNPSFSGTFIGERCHTFLHPLPGGKPSPYPWGANLTFQRGHWIGQVQVLVQRAQGPWSVTVEDLFLLEAVAMEMDARIFSWELWGKVNTAEALAMLPGVEIEENQAKPTEELTERKIWLPVSPPESGPLVTPVEFLVHKLGGEWKWDEKTGTGEVVIGDKTISLTAGSQEVVMNGESLHFDHAPQLAPPTLCIPLEMAKTLFQGLIDIQEPQVSPKAPDQAEEPAG